MKRTTVYLDELTDLELARVARQQGRAKAELIREALEDFLREHREKPREVPSWVGAGRSGMPDLAERDEELLAELLDQEYEEILADWQERQAREHSR